MDDEIILDSLWWVNLYGCDPTKYSPKKKLWTYVCLSALSAFLMLIVMGFTQANDFDAFVEIFDSLCPILQSILKLLVLTGNRDNALEILDKLKSLQKIRDVRKVKSFSRQYYYVKMFLKVMRAFYNSAVVMMILKALYLGDRTYPIRLYAPGDLSTTAFVLYFVAVSVNAFNLIILIGAFDSLYFSMLTHLIGQFQYFNACLRTMFEDGDLKELVDRHHLLLNCIELVQNTFGPQLLYQVFSNVANICLGLVIINMYGLLHLNAIIQVIMINSTFIQLFIFCFMGYQVSIQLEATTFAIYESNWWRNPHSNKNTLIMLIKSNQIHPLTIGGLMNMDLETFSEVVKKSFSFYALLNAQREEGG